MIAGQGKLVDLYLWGIISKEDENQAAEEEAGVSTRRDVGDMNVEYNAGQRHLEKNINERVDRAIMANHSETPAEADEALASKLISETSR